MLNKHLLKFGVNGGKDDRGKKCGQEGIRVLSYTVCVSILGRCGIKDTKCINTE